MTKKLILPMIYIPAASGGGGGGIDGNYPYVSDGSEDIFTAIGTNGGQQAYSDLINSEWIISRRAQTNGSVSSTYTNTLTDKLIDGNLITVISNASYYFTIYFPNYRIKLAKAVFKGYSSANKNRKIDSYQTQDHLKTGNSVEGQSTVITTDSNYYHLNTSNPQFSQWLLFYYPQFDAYLNLEEIYIYGDVQTI